MRPSKLRLPESTAVAYRSRSIISFWMTGSNAPDMPLQVVQAYATTPKPSVSSSSINLASSRYILTVFDPGASDDLTHGLRVSPKRLALRAIKPAATILRGLEVFVQLVIAAIITAPSGILPACSSALALSRSIAIPRWASSEVGK